MIEKHTLDNGLRVLVEKIPTVRSISMGIWVKTGSRNESEVNNGISHFIEHMIFKGTDKYTAKEIAETFDAIGGQVNAATSKEYTCYYAKVIDEHFDTAIEVLADMFFNSVYDPVEIDKERGVILEELYMYEDTPDDLVHDLIGQAAFGNHPLGQPIIGTREVLEAINRDYIMNYIDKFYHADNVVVALAGNVDDRAIYKIGELFSNLKQKKQANNYETIQLDKKEIYLAKDIEQTHICLATNGYPVDHDYTHAVAVVNNIIGGSMSSRLFQEIREERGMAYSVYSYHAPYLDNGIYVTYVGTSPKHVKNVLELVDNIYHDVRENGISEAELHKAKEQLKGGLVLSLENTLSRMNRLGKNELFLNRQVTIDESLDKLNAVTIDDVKAVCKHIFTEDRALAAVGPLEGDKVAK